MELRRYFTILRRRMVIIVLTVLAGIAAGYFNTPRASTYAAEATIYVGSRQLGTGEQARVSNDTLLGLERVIKTFATMIDSEPIAEAALQRVDVGRSAGTVVGETEAIPVPGTQLLKIRVTDPDPSAARDIANAVADAFVEKIGSFEPTQKPEAGELPQLPAYVFQTAKLPTVPVPNGVVRQMVLGGLFGFVLAAGAALVLEYLDVTVKGPAELEKQLELPILAVIPLDSQRRSEGHAPPNRIAV